MNWLRNFTVSGLFVAGLGSAFIAVILLSSGLTPARATEQTIHERMFHSRAIEAVVWAMPLLNFKGFRDGHASVGVG